MVMDSVNRAIDSQGLVSFLHPSMPPGALPSPSATRGPHGRKPNPAPAQPPLVRLHATLWPRAPEAPRHKLAGPARGNRLAQDGPGTAGVDGLIDRQGDRELPI